jgi:RNase P protein component
MNNSRYVPVTEDDMRNLLQHEMGFHQVWLDGTHELVFERQVENTSGKKWNYGVRVYTSVANGSTRDCGEDAIRVILVPTDTGPRFALKVLGEGNSKAGKRIYRTKNAMNNLRERCREYFRHVMSHQCPKCESVMAVRKGSKGDFLGCVNYPKCDGTKNID